MSLVTSAATILLMCLPAMAQLTATVHPGYTFSEGERPTVDTLNLLATPSIDITGTISGTVGLTAQSVTGTHLANSAVDGVTTDFNGSSPRAIIVKSSGISTNQLATNAFGAGLSGGGGAVVRVNVNSNSLAINASSNGLEIARGAAGFGLGYNTNGSLCLTNFMVTNAVPASGAGTTNAHGLGATPWNVRAFLIFTNSGVVLTAAGFQTGDIVDAATVSSYNGTFYEPGFYIGADAANVWVLENNNSSLVVRARNAGSSAGPSPGGIYTQRTNWNLVVIARP